MRARADADQPPPPPAVQRQSPRLKVNINIYVGVSLSGRKSCLWFVTGTKSTTTMYFSMYYCFFVWRGGVPGKRTHPFEKDGIPLLGPHSFRRKRRASERSVPCSWAPRPHTKPSVREATSVETGKAGCEGFLRSVR